jgi:hypothetical protein
MIASRRNPVPIGQRPSSSSTGRLEPSETTPAAWRISLADVARLAAKMGWDYVIVDGVHVPAVTFGRKTGGQRAFYSGKHKRHGLNVQTVCSPDGELLWASAALPGGTVDITAARKAGLAAVLVPLIGVLADLGYVGWDGQVITGRRKPRGKEMSPAQRAANRLQAPALPGARSVRRPARRVSSPDRYQSAMPAPPPSPYSRSTRKLRSAREENPGQTCQTGPHPAGTQDARSSIGPRMCMGN